MTVLLKGLDKRQLLLYKLSINRKVCSKSEKEEGETDVLLIATDGSLGSILANVMLAMDAKKAGSGAGVIFSEEALAALMDNKFYEMPEGLKKHSKEIADNAANGGHPLPKEPADVVNMAAGAGLPMFACPAWGLLLGVAGKIPAEITLLDAPTALKEIGAAGKVVAGL